ncbi:hypothetical protein SGRA_2858 [Saprospira grandis str. Lewin]|uniref:Uncharacterized protein n=1 Tax=Saprospira grandis (strain Lewin) TaxID=984262 RepID=H6LAJ3_SAPGL|nr:hypothetical protein SGRA_2858 [Saprospira grandis str. Lewin]
MPKRKAKSSTAVERPSDVQQWPSGQTKEPKTTQGLARIGLAMRKGAAKPQTQAVRPQGRADLRALKRSAARRSRSGGPKKTTKQKRSK